MPKGQIIEVNGIRYEAVEDDRVAFAEVALFVITSMTTTIVAVLSVARWDYMVVTLKD